VRKKEENGEKGEKGEKMGGHTGVNYVKTCI